MTPPAEIYTSAKLRNCQNTEIPGASSAGAKRVRSQFGGARLIPEKREPHAPPRRSFAERWRRRCDGPTHPS